MSQTSLLFVHSSSDTFLILIDTNSIPWLSGIKLLINTHYNASVILIANGISSKSLVDQRKKPILYTKSSAVKNNNTVASNQLSKKLLKCYIDKKINQFYILVTKALLRHTHPIQTPKNNPLSNNNTLGSHQAYYCHPVQTTNRLSILSYLSFC